MGKNLGRDELKKKRDKYIVPGVKHLFADSPNIVRGKGQYLYDENDREYLDMFAGIVTVSVGHCNPKVTKATIAQLETLQHTSTVFMTEPMVLLAEKLAELTPGTLQKCFITNSGTEANETAISLARLASGRHEVIVLRHSYHGQSHLASTLTSNHGYRPNIMPAVGIVHAENAYCYRCTYGKTPGNCDLDCAADVERVIQTQTSGQPAVMIAEPIQGVGGAITPPDGYFQKVKEILDKYGVLFIADEVQTGFGRTGCHFWGIECWDGVMPDMMTMAKGLGNGVPIGACIMTPAIADRAQKNMINTFGGNPVSCATALAVIETIQEEKLQENCRVVGKHLIDGLKDLQKTFPIIGDIRGKGLMLGIEFAEPGSKKQLPAECSKIVEISKDNGVILGKGGLWGNTIRLKPPMTVTKADADRCLEAMRKALEAVCKVGAHA